MRKVPSRCPQGCHLYKVALASDVELPLSVAVADVEDWGFVFVPFYFGWVEDCLMVASVFVCFQTLVCWHLLRFVCLHLVHFVCLLGTWSVRDH